jgi:hypothetical protein
MGARGRIGLVGRRQSILSIELVWVEAHILGQRATTPSKRFSYFTTTHVLNTSVCAVNMLFGLYFSSAGYKPRDGITKHAFVLGPIAWLRTFTLQAIIN